MNDPWIIVTKCGSYQIENNDPFLIAFPALTLIDPPQFVAVKIDHDKAICRTTSRRGAGGYQLCVSKNSRLSKYDGKQVTDLVPANRLQYDFYRIQNSPKHIIALFGLVLSVIGLVLDSVLELGSQSTPASSFMAILLMILTLFSYILKFGGLAIVFISQFLNPQ